MKIHKTKMSPEAYSRVFANHGHSSGNGLNLYDVKSREKVQITEPEFLKHKHLIIARGFHPTKGHKVAQIVKTT